MKTAVILFNMGGPCCAGKVEPFLFSLFNDKFIINLPNPLRYLLAKLISTLRNKKATQIYQNLGGGSPILYNTYQQAQALQEVLDDSYKVFVYMRYSYPNVFDVIDNVKEYSPNKIILLPLYPQYSTTTTKSSIELWLTQAKEQGLNILTCVIQSYEDHPHFIAAYTTLLMNEYKKALPLGKPVVLFSAHGIPLNRIEKGDPYQNHIQKSVQAIVSELNIPDLEYEICYQSKVGPLKWLEPYTEILIEKYAKLNRVIIVLPIAFVSEHSETLVELDIDYRRLAMAKGAKGYLRVPALGINKHFISCLKDLVLNNINT